MGAYSDRTILTEAQSDEVLRTIIHPAIQQMAAENNPFTGFLYAGLMMTSSGPKVLEFNARLGDPETQALMHRMKSDFVPALHAAATGRLAGATLDWSPDPSVCVVLAAHGYPGQVRSGDTIHGIEAAESTGAKVFHAGTKQTPHGLTTSGGRVLGVTASGPDLRSAISGVYEAVSQVRFDGMHYRKDIGAKGSRRSNGS
jgi:phosphoribosylamine--glycine ligase